MTMVGLFAAMDFAGVPVDEFNAWYDTEHIVERRGVPGFLTCERWVGTDAPTCSLGSYDLADVEVLDSPAYRAVSGENVTAWNRRVIGKCRRLFRLVADQVFPGTALAPSGAGALLFNAVNIPPELEPRFARWSDETHLPALSRVPGVLAARRFVTREGSPRHIAVYHLTSPDVQASDPWRTAAALGDSKDIVPHFRERVRIVFGQATSAT